MFPKASERSNVKNIPTLEQKKQEPPITSVSPNDPIGLKPDGTGKPGKRQE
jgi:hypothetical protein